MRGFTMVELLIVIALSFVLVIASVPIYGQLQVRAQLQETSAQLVQALRSTRENSIARYGNSAHGVFFTINPSGIDSYTLYRGTSYATRDVSFDRVQTLDSVLTITDLSFVTTGGNVDINFSPGLGKPNNVGSLLLTHVSQGETTISVNNLGKIEYE